MKTIREILEEMLNTGIEGTFKPSEFGKKKIDQAISEITQNFKDRVSVENLGFLLFMIWNKYSYKVAKEYWTGKHIKMTTKTVSVRLATELSKKLTDGI